MDSDRLTFVCRKPLHYRVFCDSFDSCDLYNRRILLNAKMPKLWETCLTQSRQDFRNEIIYLDFMDSEKLHKVWGKFVNGDRLTFLRVD